MKKLMLILLLPLLILSAGVFSLQSVSAPAKSSTVAVATIVEDDLPPKRIVPRASRERRLTPPSPSATIRKHRVTQSSRKKLTLNSVWDRLAMCESTGDWHANTGNGFYGGIQFDIPSWHEAGGIGRPDQATREEQIRRGKIWQSRYGWKPWPACARKLGLL